MTPPQLERLDALLAELRSHNGFYRERLAATSSPATSIAERLDQIPLLTKQELAEDQSLHPPYGTVLTYPVERYVRLHQTSGTSGMPIAWLDTPDSWQWFLDGWADVFRAAGVGPGDRVFFAFSFGPFIGFWAAFESCRQMGVMALSGGALSTEQRLEALLRHHATVLVSTPTYALRLAEAALAGGHDLAASEVRLTLHAGEPGASIPSVRARLEELWGARCVDHAGATEVGPWGIPGRDDFMHVNEREFVAEILDPETGERLQPAEGGVRGELVLTNLGRWGSPVLRYRTGDLVEAWPGRGTDGTPESYLRLRGGVLARVDDMVVVRGVNVYPSAIEALVRDFERTSGLRVEEYQVRVRRHAEMVELEMEAEITGDAPEKACARLGDALRSALALRVPVRVADPGSLPRFELKARRFHVEDAPEP